MLKWPLLVDFVKQDHIERRPEGIFFIFLSCPVSFAVCCRFFGFGRLIALFDIPASF